MPNLSKEIVQFANGNTDFYTAFQDYYAHDTYSRTGKKLVSFSEVPSLDEKASKVSDAFFAEVARVSGVVRTEGNKEAWALNPMVRWATFSVIDTMVNSVLPMTINPSIGIYTDIRYVSLGDVVKFRIKPRTLFTVSLSAMGERTTFRQRDFASDQIVAPIDHMVTVYEDMLSALSGHADLADMIRRVVISVETAMTADATTALTTGMAQGTYPAALSIQGAFNTQTMIKLAETVQAYNYGARPMIIGTASALTNVVGDSAMGFRGNYDAANGSINLLSDFYGYTLFQLPQVATGDYSTMSLALPDDTLFVVSPAIDKLVKLVVSNTLSSSNDYFNSADLTKNFDYHKAWNTAFLSAGFGGMYKITE